MPLQFKSDPWPENSLCHRVAIKGKRNKGKKQYDTDTGRYMDQWNRTASPKINPYFYCQLIYDKGGKTIQWGKGRLFKMVLGKLDNYMPKNQIGLLSHTIYKYNLKMY